MALAWDVVAWWVVLGVMLGAVIHLTEKRGGGPRGGIAV